MPILRNFTPHTVILHLPMFSETPLEFPSEGVARATEEVISHAPIKLDYWRDCGMHVDVPLVSLRHGNVTGLPAPSVGTVYIVSVVVLRALPERTDLVIPHDTVRDEQGRVVGCRAFAR